MQKTYVFGALLSIVALVGVTPAFAEMTFYQTESVQWITGEQVLRTTIMGVCGEKNVHQIQSTFFDDYVQVLKIENGDYEIQRYFDYNSYGKIISTITAEVLFC